MAEELPGDVPRAGSAEREDLAAAMGGRSSAAAEEVQRRSERLDREGFSQANFFAGVLNMVVTAFVFGRWPEHAWVLYGGKCAVLIPVWYRRVIIYRRGHLHILDICWVMNIASAVYLGATLVGLMPDAIRNWAFRTFFMNAMGFQSWSAIMLSNSLVFHSVEKTAALLIHLTPAMVCLTLRWGQERLGVPIEEVWGGYFPNSEQNRGTRAGALLLAAVVPYGAWWVLYAGWLVVFGADLHTRGWSTLFAHFYEKRKLGQLFGKLGLHGLRSHAMLYMLAHGLLSVTSFAWALLCWRVFVVHLVWVCAIILYIIWNGADYYVETVVKSYGPIINRRRTGGSVELVETAGRAVA